MLCAYFMLTFMPVGMGEYSFAVYVIGGILSIKATWSLKDYCPKFRIVSLLSLGYVLLGTYLGVAYVDTIFLWGVMPAGDVATNVVQAITYALELGYHIFMLLSVMWLTAELELPKLQAKAKTNLALALVWGLGQIALLVIPGAAAFQAQVFPKMLLLWSLVCYILNVLLLHGCFQNICPAGEEYGKEPKPSRFGFINRINQKMQERNAKALQETLDYHAEKQRRREEKKSQRKKRR